MKCLLTLLTLFMMLPAHGREIYKCEHQGVPLYSHLPCAPDARPLELPTLGRLGSQEDAAAVRDRLQALQSLAVPAPSRPAPAEAPRPGLSYGERIQLRKLEMRADNLRRDMLNRRGDAAWRQATGQALRSLQQQINNLRARQ